MDHLGAAYYAADGAGDLTLAKTETASGIASISSAAALVDGIAASSDQASVQKSIATALKAANATASAIDGKKKLAKLYKLARTALDLTTNASRAVRVL